MSPWHAATWPGKPGGASGGRTRVIEIGSGFGDILICLKSRGCEVLGTDPSRAGAEKAREHGMEVRVGNLAELGRRRRRVSTPPCCATASSTCHHAFDAWRYEGRHRSWRLATRRFVGVLQATAATPDGGDVLRVIAEKFSVPGMKERWPDQPANARRLP